MDKTMLRVIVGGELRARREAQHLSLQDLAIMSGTSYTHLWKIEKGKVSVGLDLLGRVCEALDLPMYEVFSKVDGPASSVTVEYLG